jgi:hypothetical protein
MSGPALRVLSALLVLAAVGCASPTAPTLSRRPLDIPAVGAAFDEIVPTPTDTTCRSGYMNGQGYTC